MPLARKSHKVLLVDRDRFPSDTLSSHMIHPTAAADAGAEIREGSGPVIKLVEASSASDPARLSEFRRDFETLAAEYFRDNLVRQGYLPTSATKI